MQADKALQTAYHPIVEVPTILNGTGTAAGVVITNPTDEKKTRRMRVYNSSATAAFGIVWAQRTDADSVITAQSISTASLVAPGATEYFLIGGNMKTGVVGLAATFNITISDI